MLDLSSVSWIDWQRPDIDAPSNLYAGRLDGRSFEVIEFQTEDYSFGSLARPVAGFGLAHWADAGNDPVIDLIDTATGKRTTIVSGSDINPGAIDPTATYIYWTTATRNGPTGLWRRPIAGGETEQVLDGRSVPGSTIRFSADGRLVALGGMGEFAVFDGNFKRLGSLSERRYGELVGLLGDRLIVTSNRIDDGDFASVLYELETDNWSATEIASVEAGSSAILPDIDGSHRLVFDGWPSPDRYSVNVLHPDGSSRIVFTADARYADEGFGIAAQFEIPGWVVVSPGGGALRPPWLSDDLGYRWRLVRLTDGATVEFEPPEIQAAP